MPSRLLAICLLAAIAAAQPVEKLLPAGARVIETADVSVGAKTRLLVLWMLNPSRHVRRPGTGYCGDEIEGDYFEGRTRLALLDPAVNEVINTIAIKMGDADSSQPRDTFRIPFLVTGSYYHVPRPNAHSEGKPEILHLRDLTGEGYEGQFPLFIYQSCGNGSLTALLGYSRLLDRAIQYPVEVHLAGERSSSMKWPNEIFAVAPIRPGRWEFNWSPGHGVDDTVYEDVTFDKSRQVFIDRQKIVAAK